MKSVKEELITTILSLEDKEISNDDVENVNKLKANYIEFKNELDILSLELNKNIDELNLNVSKFSPQVVNQTVNQTEKGKLEQEVKRQEDKVKKTTTELANMKQIFETQKEKVETLEKQLSESIASKKTSGQLKSTGLKPTAAELVKEKAELEAKAKLEQELTKNRRS